MNSFNISGNASSSLVGNKNEAIKSFLFLFNIYDGVG